MRTPLPAHAVEEIKRDPSQKAFWDAWQEVGDRKLEQEDAARSIAVAESAWMECRHATGMARTPGIECGCGKHTAEMGASRKKFDATADPLARAIRKFKGR